MKQADPIGMHAVRAHNENILGCVEQADAHPDCHYPEPSGFRASPVSFITRIVVLVLFKVGENAANSSIFTADGLALRTLAGS